MRHTAVYDSFVPLQRSYQGSIAERGVTNCHFDDFPRVFHLALILTRIPAKTEHRLLYGEPGSAEATKPASVIVDFAKKWSEDANEAVLTYLLATEMFKSKPKIGDEIRHCWLSSPKMVLF